MRWALGLLIVFALGCSTEDECGANTEKDCPAGEICVLDEMRGVCAQTCATDDDCTEGGTCEDCLASGDCPTCDVCVRACW